MAEHSLPVFVFGCTSCGKTVSGREAACPRCGASFEGVMFECPFCGELVSPTDRACESCGTEFESFAEEVSEASSVDLDGPVEPPESASRSSQAREIPQSSETVEYECPVCGKPVGENDMKCPHCGAQFG
ncbi:MAG: zinc ribbon domain-containing protein [Thermoplasmata archaeon]